MMQPAMPTIEDEPHVIGCEKCQQACLHREFIHGDCNCTYAGDMPIIGSQETDIEAHCPVCGDSVYERGAL